MNHLFHHDGAMTEPHRIPSHDVLQYARAPKQRSRTGRVEIDRTEYKLLREIAGLAVVFYPVVEQTSAPVGRAREFEAFRKALKQYVLIRSVTETDAEVLRGLTDLLHDLTD